MDNNKNVYKLDTDYFNNGFNLCDNEYKTV